MSTMLRPLQNRSDAGGGPSASAMSREYRVKIGQTIRSRRLEIGMTQVELGNLVGVVDTAISHIESGHSSIKPDHYAALADALEFDKAEWGKFLVRYTNPWAYALIYGTRSGELREDLARVAVRVHSYNQGVA